MSTNNTNTLEIRPNGGTLMIISGKVQLARLLQIAGAFILPIRHDAVLHLKLDELQVRGAWETDSDLIWQGYDYVNQAWINVELQAVQS